MFLKLFLKVYKFMGVNGEVFFGINLLEFYLFFICIFGVYLFENVLNKFKKVFYLRLF